MSDDDAFDFTKKKVQLCHLPKRFSKMIVVTVLKEVLDQLGILKLVNTWTDDDKYEFIYETLEDRFSSHFSNIKNAQCKDLNLEDFRSDCAFLESVIKDTFEEIITSETHEKLKRINKIYSDTLQDEIWLEEDTKKKEEEFKKVENLLEEERASFVKKINKVMTDIGNIKDEIEDFMVEADIKENFVESWEASRIEQNKIRLNQQEDKLKDYIKTQDHEFSREIRVHQEVGYIYNEIDDDLQNEIKKWQNRYKQDKANIMEKIEKLNEKREKLKETKSNLQKLYEKRQKEIENYEQYRIQQEEKRKEMEKRNKAATKIQAWWRGTMVRKGFGKFRKKKDKKGKKKADTKKNK